MKPTLLLGLVACAASAWTTANAQQQATAAEALFEDKWDFRPITGAFKNGKPEYGPAEVRTFLGILGEPSAFSAVKSLFLPPRSLRNHDTKL